jgi:hypothetical protein
VHHERQQFVERLKLCRSARSHVLNSTRPLATPDVGSFAELNDKSSIRRQRGFVYRSAIHLLCGLWRIRYSLSICWQQHTDSKDKRAKSQGNSKISLKFL